MPGFIIAELILFALWIVVTVYNCTQIFSKDLNKNAPAWSMTTMWALMGGIWVCCFGLLATA